MFRSFFILNKVKLFLVFAFLFLFLACSQTRTPKNVIKQKKMAKVLSDCYLAEAYINELYLEEKEKPEYTQAAYKEIFEKYNISPEEFGASYHYYILHFSELQEIYENAINELNAIN